MKYNDAENKDSKSFDKLDTKMIIDKEETSDNKAKSEEQQKKLKALSEFNIKNSFFVAKKISDFNNIVKGFQGRIKSIVMSSGEIISKLSPNELSLEKCTEIAIDYIDQMKTKDGIYLILTYDNTNEYILYNCLKRLNDFDINVTDEYKYCLTNEVEINIKNKLIIEKNLRALLNYNFVFNDIIEGQKKLSVILLSLSEFSDLYISLKKNKKIKSDILYYLDNNEKILLPKKNEDKEINELYLKGYNFIEFYPKVKDFDNFKNNHPYNYNNNKILYIFFIIHLFYSYFIEYKSNTIKIIPKFILLIYNFSSLIYSIIDDLNKNLNNNKEFFIKIRFLTLLFNLDIKQAQYSRISKEFKSHIFATKFNEKDALIFVNNKKAIDAVEHNKNNYYEATKKFLLIKEGEFEVSFNYDDYPCILNHLLLYSNNVLHYTWENNTLSSFQVHNFYIKEDIEFLKKLIKEILKSNFYKDIEDTYIEHDLYNGHIFDDDKRVDEFINNLFFIPFYPKHLGISGYTFSNDLIIFISGYPMIKNSNDPEDYKINRILNLSFLTIIILHESIHYCKRLLYYITCGIISRETDEGLESGYIFEKLLFGWGDNDNTQYYKKNEILESKKINIFTALKILNPNTYKYKINEVKDILYNNHNEEKYGDILKNYFELLELGNDMELDEFIECNKDKTIDAKRNYENEYYIECFSSDHRKVKNFHKK